MPDVRPRLVAIRRRKLESELATTSLQAVLRSCPTDTSCAMKVRREQAEYQAIANTKTDQESRGYNRKWTGERRWEARQG